MKLKFILILSAVTLLLGVFANGCDKKVNPDKKTIATSEKDNTASAPAEKKITKATEIKPAPVITEVKGAYKVYKAKSEQTVWDDGAAKSETGFKLKAGQKVATEKESRVMIKFPDASEARLGPETEIVIDSFDEKSADGISIQLIIGEIFNKVKKAIGGDKKYTVSTPTAVAGVRGTEFHAAVAEDCSSIIAVNEGEVEVEAEEQKIKLKANQLTEITTFEIIKPKFMMKIEQLPEKKLSIAQWRKDKKLKLQKDPQKYAKAMMAFAVKKENKLKLIIDKGEKINTTANTLASRLKVSSSQQEQKEIREKLKSLKNEHEQLGRNARTVNTGLKGSILMLSNLEQGKSIDNKDTIKRMGRFISKNKIKIDKLKTGQAAMEKKAKKIRLIKGKVSLFKDARKFKLREMPVPFKKEVKEIKKRKRKAVEEKAKKHGEKILKINNKKRETKSDKKE